jgi:hypothetical protein
LAFRCRQRIAGSWPNTTVDTSTIHLFIPPDGADPDCPKVSLDYIILLITHPEENGTIALRTFTESFWLADGIDSFFDLLITH